MLRNSLEKKRILVTGGAGFIGSNLVAHFLRLGCEIVVVDNLSTGFRENLKPFLQNPDFTFVEGDVCDEALMLSVALGIDSIVHLAALGSVPRSIENPAQTIHANIDGTASVFQAAVRNAIKRVVYASSSSVYGDSPTLPKREGDEGQPLSPYALSKAVDEQLAKIFHRVYGLQTIGLRFFNVFGPNQTSDSPYAAVIPKFVAAMLDSQPPVVNGSLDISRDFTFVEDVVDAIDLSLTAKLPSDAISPVLNISGGCEYSLEQLIKALQTATRKLRPNMVFQPPVISKPRPGDIPHSKADISLAKKILGYAPRHSFDDAIAQTVSWFMEK